MLLWQRGMCTGIGEGVPELRSRVCVHMFCAPVRVHPRVTNAESLGRERMSKGQACSPGGHG